MSIFFRKFAALLVLLTKKLTILDSISQRRKAGRKMLVRLIDPEKFDGNTRCDGFSMIFVGGSTAASTEAVVEAVRTKTKAPVVLFPGNVRQFTPKADALLFLTLMNSRDPLFLIEPQIAAAEAVAASGIETIPMGYILLDGGRQSAVERVTGCKAIAQDDEDEIVRTAIAAELMGKKLVYLEAGSGAKCPVKPSIITAVRSQLHVPLIVGGGIRTTEQMAAAFDAGADIGVIGNLFEEKPDEIERFVTTFKERI